MKRRCRCGWGRPKPLFPPVDEQSGQRLFSKGTESHSVLTSNGRVELARKRWYLKGVGSRSPLDKLVDAAEATLSIGVRELCARIRIKNFDRAAEALYATAQIRLSGELLRQTVESDGKLVLALAKSGDLLPVWTAADCETQTPDGRTITRMYMGMDGFTTPTITATEKHQRREKVVEKRRLRAKAGQTLRPLLAAKAGTDGPFKETKIITFYDQTITYRHISVTRGDCDVAGLLMKRDADRLGFGDADESIANVDGGPWIINQVHKHHLPVTATGLDFYHLGDNVHKSRRIAFGEPEKPGDANDPGNHWAGKILHTAKHEGYQPLWEELVDWRKTLRGNKRQEAERLINYVSDRREMIRYPEFIEHGWQIGSGPTESECRLVPDRVKGIGMRWDPDNSEGMMALDALEESGQRAEFWRLVRNCRN